MSTDEIPIGDETPDEADRTARPMPLPSNPQTILLLGIFLLLLFFTLQLAAAIIVPIVFALILSLLLRPVMRMAAKAHIPNPITALIIIAMFFGGVVQLGYSLSGPATEWLAKAPRSISHLERRLDAIKKPGKAFIAASKRLDQITETAPSNPGQKPVHVAEPSLSSTLFTSTRAMLVSFGITIVLLFFLLSAGDLFLRRTVEVLPSLHNKKQMVEISREIEQHIAGYLATISMMNLGVGIMTGLGCYFTGLSDPILWGTLAFALNYIPIIGPLFGMAGLAMVGLLTFPTTVQALLPAGIYLMVHLAEGQIITPMLLARRFVLNPVLVILSIIFWYWMWGVAGAFLAVPMLAVTKLISDRITPLMALGHFLGGEARN